MSDLSYYSPGRARQIGILLWAAIVLAGLAAGLAGWLVGTGFGPEAIVMAVPSLLILGTSGMALRALREGTLAAKRWSIAAGVVLIMIGLFFAQTPVSILPSIVGVLLVLLAMIADHGER
ncbi:hypothetical protein [Nocardioides sp.]|uniref:hypothetical protein n=1 Tax=Nocardioides sp. TaxID=35761 RepID=UPI002D805818|nr:hypothetical protein [Nocardioides sp.]HET8962101.1 hypothetical protein [Nocardioides sp.]